jgi:hypothetical protein
MKKSDSVINIDSRSHLEVADKKHRYAKNLRLYFKEYHRLYGISDITDPSVTSSNTNAAGSSSSASSVLPNSATATSSRKWARYEPFFEWLDNPESLPDVRNIFTKL